MANFASGSAAAAAALAVIDARLQSIDTTASFESYKEWISLRAAIRQSLAPAFTLSATNLGAANAGFVKATAGAVYSLKVTNKNAAVRYFQIVNKATAPTNSDSALILDVIAVPTNTTVVINETYFGDLGLTCSTGIGWAFSSTDITITLATATDVISTIGYV
jgi:hypothetical protein